VREVLWMLVEGRVDVSPVVISCAVAVTYLESTQLCSEVQFIIRNVAISKWMALVLWVL
jgi:hypothetical protein